jgi:hypothetical protein
MCDATQCPKIVSRSATGADYVIEGNRKVWITEDGQRWVDDGGRPDMPEHGI